jgi:hypothetical protein
MLLTWLPVQSASVGQVSGVEGVLIGNLLEFDRSTDRVLSDLVGKLDDSTLPSASLLAAV